MGERNWVIIESELSGAVDGVARYILPEEHALVLADVMMGEEGDDPPDEFDEVYESAIVEMYNQVVNSLANKLNEITGKDIELNPQQSEVLSGDEFLEQPRSKPSRLRNPRRNLKLRRMNRHRPAESNRKKLKM